MQLISMTVTRWSLRLNTVICAGVIPKSMCSAAVAVPTTGTWRKSAWLAGLPHSSVISVPAAKLSTSTESREVGLVPDSMASLVKHLGVAWGAFG